MAESCPGIFKECQNVLQSSKDEPKAIKIDESQDVDGKLLDLLSKSIEVNEDNEASNEDGPDQESDFDKVFNDKSNLKNTDLTIPSPSSSPSQILDNTPTTTTTSPFATN